ncbi:hypothetical protein K4G95_25090, partial [Mycobacterium tuberculosis]|nr:hypothetical protein [Mycobacterium tuberculosis]
MTEAAATDAVDGSGAVEAEPASETPEVESAAEDVADTGAEIAEPAEAVEAGEAGGTEEAAVIAEATEQAVGETEQ